MIQAVDNLAVVRGLDETRTAIIKEGIAKKLQLTANR
jgi:hypothetical protein